MARASKGKSSCWYGYLMAGERSSPVLRDTCLETGSTKTIYMYNLKRGEIIEYSLEVVEKKLRDLTPEEAEYIEELDTGYKKARRGFKARVKGKQGVAIAAVATLRKVVNYTDDDEIDIDDSAMWQEPEEA